MYLLILVMSVFLGSKLFAVPTPVAQITLYRLLALGAPMLLAFQLFIKQQTNKLLYQSDATRALMGYLFWWFWAFLSVIWVVDLKLWFQAFFLMSLGIFAIVAIYFWTSDLLHWYQLISGIWLMMSFQVYWGLFEIITGKYFFADLDKLDKMGTFISQPMTRIPITSFANQNDYATLLLAFLSITSICYYRTNSFWWKLIILFNELIASYLIYRSDSRMALLMLIFFILLHCAIQFKIHLQRKHYFIVSIVGIVGIASLFMLKPSLLKMIINLLLSLSNQTLSGDGARINLWKNGLLFLAETGGIGVGAGNIEAWMAEVPTYPVNNLVNIHNWWFEVLVGYGVIVFFIYCAIYWLLLRRLWSIMQYQKGSERYTARGLFTFMLVYIFSSITSSSNMLIEWHWIIFGLIISYIKIIEMQNIRGVVNEFSNDYV